MRKAMRAENKKQIDVVIAWVDGDDVQLKAKRARYQETSSAASDATSSTRFASNDEIYYNLSSLLAKRVELVASEAALEVF